MEVDELSEPKMVKESRLIQTLITTKPDSKSFLVSAGMLLIIGIVTQIFWKDLYGVADLLPVSKKSLFVHGEVWRAFTATLIHADLGHYLSNAYMLFIFGYFIYGYFGAMVYPLYGFLLSGIVNALTVVTYPEETRLLGASGMVYWLGGFWLTSYFFIQRQHPPLNRTLRVLGIGVMVFFPTSFVPTTSYRAHAIGFGVGAAFAVLHFFLNKSSIRSYEAFKHIFVESEPEAEI